jgi:hypothetical protein
MCGIGMKICVWCSGSIEEQGVEKVRLGRHSPVHMHARVDACTHYC